MSVSTRSLLPFTSLVALTVLLATATRAAATCDDTYTTRIGPPAMAQPNGAFQTYAGDCTGTAGCGDFFDIRMEQGDTLDLSFCSNGGAASFATDLVVRGGYQFEDGWDCEYDVCGGQAEVHLEALDAGLYRVRIGFGSPTDVPVDGTYTLAYSAPVGRVITPTTCANGTLDAGEECDDGNELAGDCCSPSCTFEPAGDACPDDGNSCTDEACDGAGTCTHPNTPVNAACDDDGNTCTDELCDGNGTCDHPPLPAGTPCYDGEAVFCTNDVCDAAAVCTHTFVPGCHVLDVCPASQPPGPPVTFPHPKATKKFSTYLVQAFVSCNNPGGLTPDRTTEGGVPACEAETADDIDGNPANGWHWGPSSYGRMEIFWRCKGADDFGIRLQFNDIVDGNGAPVNDSGTLIIMTRLTLMDPGGAMTMIDFPLQVAFGVSNGAVKFQTSANAVLADMNLPPLPNGVTVAFGALSSVDPSMLQVLDGNGNPFARPGVFLPPVN